MGKGKRRKKCYCLSLTPRYAEVLRNYGIPLSTLVDEMLSALRVNAQVRGFEEALWFAAERGLELLRNERKPN